MKIIILIGILSLFLLVGCVNESSDLTTVFKPYFESIDAKLIDINNSLNDISRILNYEENIQTETRK